MLLICVRECRQGNRKASNSEDTCTWPRLSMHGSWWCPSKQVAVADLVADCRKKVKTAECRETITLLLSLSNSVCAASKEASGRIHGTRSTRPNSKAWPRGQVDSRGAHQPTQSKQKQIKEGRARMRRDTLQRLASCDKCFTDCNDETRRVVLGKRIVLIGCADDKFDGVYVAVAGRKK